MHNLHTFLFAHPSVYISIEEVLLTVQVFSIVQEESDIVFPHSNDVG